MQATEKTDFVYMVVPPNRKDDCECPYKFGRWTGSMHALRKRYVTFFGFPAIIAVHVSDPRKAEETLNAAFRRENLLIYDRQSRRELVLKSSLGVFYSTLAKYLLQVTALLRVTMVVGWHSMFLTCRRMGQHRMAPTIIHWPLGYGGQALKVKVCACGGTLLTRLASSWCDALKSIVATTNQCRTRCCIGNPTSSLTKDPGW